MILDARDNPYAREFTVYCAKTCRVVKDAVWVNDETAQWGRYRVAAFDRDTDTLQEDRITIYLIRRLVIFNEVEDSEPAESLAETKGVPA